MTSTQTNAEFDSLLGEDFVVPDNEIDAVLSQYKAEEYDVDDPDWVEIRAKAIGNRRLGFRRWFGRIIKLGRNARDQAEVRDSYETHWSRAETLDQFMSILNNHKHAVQWRQHGMIVMLQVLRQVQLLYLMRAVKTLQPRRVLEVGCGNGNILLNLAARFPDVKFSGVELTEKGIAVAQAAQLLSELPAGMVENSPEPIVDLNAHQGVELRVGDAKALPYSDHSFDLVYSVLALEQMEQIREQALKEICRVSAQALLLFEPWREYNLKDPGRAYVRRTGYFTGRMEDVKRLGFKVVHSTADIPQKVQFNVGPVIAVRD